MISREAEILVLSFLWDGATIIRTPLLNILVSGVNILVLFYNLLISKVVYLMVVKIWHLYMYYIYESHEKFTLLRH